MAMRSGSVDTQSFSVIEFPYNRILTLARTSSEFTEASAFEHCFAGHKDDALAAGRRGDRHRPSQTERIS